jgi:endonuclease/exonuclease/phosphatase family metal-dependent hydrolase
VLVLLLFRSRYLLLPLAAFLFALVSFGGIYGFSGEGGVPPEGHFTVMSYNTRGFNARRNYEPKNAGEQIVEFVTEQDPDIVCFQEFNRTYLPFFKGYQDRFVTPATSGKSPQAIFSRFPIANVGMIPFPDSGNSGVFADILIGGDTLRVYNIHLESYQIADRRFITANYGRDFLQRLYGVALKHRQQAQLVRDHVDTSPYPTVVCGDLNATPFSRPYRMLSRGMRDSFKEKGRGWGATYYLNQMLPYRIDVILLSRGMQVYRHQNFEVGYSDHLPILVTLKTEGK